MARAAPDLAALRPFEVERGNDPPAVSALADLHERAIREGASDLHFEPHGDGGRVRERIDGLLREVAGFPSELFAQIVSRVKVLASMDIADKRQPQDGHYHIDSLGRSLDARVSSIPTICGEKLVVRLLDLHQRLPTLERLGMEAPHLARFRRLIHAPHGFVVVCGPTGSGKTTTLYASLGERNDTTQHVCSVEDPVEARLAGVAQVQVNARAGLSFESTLRSFLRQDPNVIMVGEMRDGATASVAMSAALSGALVLTSLHSRDACSAIDRLIELGLRRQALAAALTGIVAQRLVRVRCVACTNGCPSCNWSQYAGRIGIFECVVVNEEIRTALAAEGSSQKIREIAQRHGFEPMLRNGLRRVAEGVSTSAELQRVLAVDAC